MKFFAAESLPIYLSVRGPQPPPLRFFDVFYDEYPTVGFSTVGSDSRTTGSVYPAFTPDPFDHHDAQGYSLDSETFEEDAPPPTEDLLMSDIVHYGRQTGKLEQSQPLRIPGGGVAPEPCTPRPHREPQDALLHGLRPADLLHFVVTDGAP